MVRNRATIGLAGAKAPPIFSKIRLKVFKDMEIRIVLVGINGRYKKNSKANSFVNQNGVSVT